MNSSEREALVDLLCSELAVAVLRGDDPDSVYEDALVILEGGLRAIEITLTVPHAVDVIRRLAENTDAIVGAGSVRTAADVDDCLDAGAQFIVSPACCPEMIQRCVETNLVSIPGAMTPTEVLRAWELGADLVKIFPAARLGPAFLSDLKGPLPEIPLVPTGGITDKNATEYLDAGAALVCFGSWLTAGNRDETRRRAQLIRALVNDYKENYSVQSA